MTLRPSQGGDREAFDEAVLAERSRLAAFVHARLGPRLRKRHDVDDVLQETFLRAFRSIKRFEWKKDDSLFAWLGSIAELFIRDLARDPER